MHYPVHPPLNPNSALLARVKCHLNIKGYLRSSPPFGKEGANFPETCRRQKQGGIFPKGLIEISLSCHIVFPVVAGRLACPVRTLKSLPLDAYCRRDN